MELDCKTQDTTICWDWIFMGDILNEAEYQREKGRLLFALAVIGTDSRIGRGITQRLIELLEKRDKSDK